MSKSRHFSIYLLKNGFDANNSLKEDHALEENSSAGKLPRNATLYLKKSPARSPWWREYFGISDSLLQSLNGALIFLPVDENVFVLTFGSIAHNLKDDSYEYDFGIRITLNCIDPEKLKNIDALDPSVARRQRTQLSVDSSLTYFEFDHDSTVLKSLTGRVKEQYSMLIRRVTGASSLRANSSIQSEELTNLCSELVTIYKSEEYKEIFPNIQNIVPVRDPLVLSQLDQILIEAFRSKNEQLMLGIPDFIDYRESILIRYAGFRSKKKFNDVYMNDYYDELTNREVLIELMDKSDLKNHKLRLLDENGNKRAEYSIFKSLIFDTVLDDENKTYYLSEGNWYEVDRDFISRLENELIEFKTELGLAPYRHENEGAYNKDVAKNDINILCLDRQNIHLPGQTAVEPCDLYRVEDDTAVFIHVKRSTRSTGLSHLFNQGTNSIELLKSNRDFLQELEQLIEKVVVENQNLEAFKKPLEHNKFKVIFAIITSRAASGNSVDLPLFSKISLRRSIRSFELMNVEVEYGYIADRS